jgi:hypothetical protein
MAPFFQSSTMNCQQFARLFLMEGLGLTWPEDIVVAGDILPVIIDVVVLYTSSKNKVKAKKQNKSEKNN